MQNAKVSMSKSVSDRLTHYQNATEDDSVVKGEVVGVGAFGSFSTGWIGYDFMYEQPRILIDLNTEIGDFQLELDVDELDNEILSLINDGKTDLKNLIGRTMYIAPNEQFSRACISPDSKPVFENNSSYIIRSGDDNRQNVKQFDIDTDMSLSGVQKMPLDRINYILRTEIRRRFNGEYGWIKTEVEMNEKSDRVDFKADIGNPVQSIRWSFDSGVDSYENIQSFLNELNLGHILAEGCGEVWIKPIRDLHFTNRPEDTDLISDNQVWVASDEPLKPEKDKPSLVDRIKRFFSTKDTVDVSVGRNRSKKARIAEQYSEYQYSCCFNNQNQYNRSRSMELE